MEEKNEDRDQISPEEITPYIQESAPEAGPQSVEVEPDTPKAVEAEAPDIDSEDSSTPAEYHHKKKLKKLKKKLSRLKQKRKDLKAKAKKARKKGKKKKAKALDKKRKALKARRKKLRAAYREAKDLD